MQQTKQKFDWKSFIPAIATIAIPVALQNLLTTAGGMVDTMMIGRLGENSVGAVGFAAQLSYLMVACYWGFIGGGMLFMAQYWGAKDEDGLTRSYGMTLTFVLSVALIFMMFATCFPELVMSVYTDKPVIQELAVPYLRIAGFGYPFMALSIAASSLLRSTERVRIPLYASIAAVLTNVLMNWVLIFGHLGAPALGIRGAAIATVISQVVNFGVVIGLSAVVGFKYLFRVRAQFRWTRSFLKQYLKKCFPVICNELGIGLSGMLISIVLGRQIEAAIAAVAVFRTVESIFTGFFNGFSNAMSILVGKSVGAGELDTAYERAKRIIPVCAVVMATLSLILQFVKRPLLIVMGLSGESLAIGEDILLKFGFIIIIRMCNWGMNDTYRSAGDAVTGTTLELVFMYLMVIPTVYISFFALHVPFGILFMLIYCDEPIRFVLMQIHMYSACWVRPVTPEGQAALPPFAEKHPKLKKRLERLAEKEGKASV